MKFADAEEAVRRKIPFDAMEADVTHDDVIHADVSTGNAMRMQACRCCKRMCSVSIMCMTCYSSDVMSFMVMSPVALLLQPGVLLSRMRITSISADVMHSDFSSAAAGCAAVGDV